MLKLLIGLTSSAFLSVALPGCKKVSCIGPGRHDCPTPADRFGLEITELNTRFRLNEPGFRDLVSRFDSLSNAESITCVSANTELMEQLTIENQSPQIVALVYQWTGEQTCHGLREIRIEAQRMDSSGLYAINTLSFPTLTETQTDDERP